MAPIHHHPADRLAAHAAALQQPAQFPATVAPELTQHHPQQQAQAPDVSNWAADFTKFASQQRQRPQHHHQQQQHPMFQNAFGFQQQQQQQPGVGFSPFFAPAGSAYGQAQQAPAGEADFDKEMAQWMAANGSGGGGNMEQVDAAMEQMARELALNDSVLPDSAEVAGIQSQEQAAEAVAAEEAHFSDLGVREMSNLTLESRGGQQLATMQDDQQQQELLDREAEAEDAAKGKSAVSEAAERLLESVQHESGEKWQNSVFLQLMRDFRDGRKDIVDNEVRQMEEDGDDHSDRAAAAGCSPTMPAT